jgi:hypothetical protein
MVLYEGDRAFELKVCAHLRAPFLVLTPASGAVVAGEDFSGYRHQFRERPQPCTKRSKQTILVCCFKQHQPEKAAASCDAAVK